MKIISLNTWGGRGGKENLLRFIERYKGVDIFCLQEMWNGGEDVASQWGEGIDTRILTNIGNILKDHNVFFYPHYHDWYGLAMFVKKSIAVFEEGDIFVHKSKGWVHEKFNANHARNLQYVTIETDKGIRTVLNLHGLWNGQGKSDTDERILQSDNIINFIKGLKTDYVLMGDFNLRPDTQSLKKLEDFGLRNLIKEYNIISTRTPLYTKSEKFADYTFVSKGIEVSDFKVLLDVISDHSPMYIECQ